MRVRGKITAAAVGSLLAAGVPSGVARAEPGLTVDPQSPAGVEYAIPLNSGRGHGGGKGHSGGGGSGGGSSALFGSGITPPSNTSSGTGPSGAGTGGSGGAGGGSGGSTGHRGSSSKPRSGSHSSGGATPPGVAPVSAAASYSTSGPVAGIVGGILALGGGLGLFLRLRGRRTPSDRQLP
jgi:hypothetical protein